MADSILKRDQNRVTVSGGVTDDSAQEIRPFLVDPSTGRLLVSASGSGIGDVTGPASSTDNAIARFDGTTGKIIQNSAVIVDDNGNTLGNDFVVSSTSTATAGGTTTLTVASTPVQIFTGSSSQTVVLPSATTLTNGKRFWINNNSSGTITVQDNGGNTLYTAPAGGYIQVNLLTSLTANGTWDIHPMAPSVVTWGSGTTGLVMNSALTTSPSINAGISSSTVPAFLPQRGSSTTGYSGDSSNLYGIIGGTAVFTATSAGDFSATTFSANNTAAAIGTFSTYSDTATTGAQISLRHARGTIASPTATLSGDRLGTLNFAGYHTSVSASFNGSNVGIRGYASENQSTTNQGGYLAFFIKANATITAVESMYLDQDGSLTIGTTKGTGSGALYAGAGTFTGLLTGTDLVLTSARTTTNPITITAGSVTSGTIAQINGDALTTGYIINAWSNSSSTSTRTLFNIENTNALATGTTTVNIGNASTGTALKVTGISKFSSTVSPLSSDGAALGSTSLMWSDLFLASGAVVNFNNGNYTMTHSSGVLTLSGDLTVQTNMIIGGNATSSNISIEIGNTAGGTPFFDFKRNNVDYDARLILSSDTTFDMSFRQQSSVFTVGGHLSLYNGTVAGELRLYEPSGSGTNYSAFKAQAQSADITYTLPATVGASGTVLTAADGSGGLSWTTPTSTSTPKMIISTAFETSGRFTGTAVGTGSATFNTTGLTIASGATSGSSENVLMDIVGSGSADIYAGSPSFSCSVYLSNVSANASAAGSTLFAIGQATVAGTGHTYTVRHVGFKLVKAAGVTSLYATQADGTTETASSALTTVVTGDSLDLICQINGTSSVDYYYRKNGGALSSATNLTTNIPSGTSFRLQVSTSNDSTAFVNDYQVFNMSYQR